MTTHIFFDAGNTIVYVNMAYVSEALARRGARATPEALWASEHRARAALDDPEVIRGTTDGSRWGLYFERIFAGCGIAEREVVEPVLAELRARHAVENLWEVVPPEVPRTLEALRRRHRLAVISNANGTVREKLRRVGLLPFFDLVLDSHEEGIEKPDPRLFRSALERTGARAEASVYVGDMYHIDVVGARAAGLRPVLVDPVDVYADKDVPRIRDLDGLVGWIDALTAPSL